MDFRTVLSWSDFYGKILVYFNWNFLLNRTDIIIIRCGITKQFKCFFFSSRYFIFDCHRKVSYSRRTEARKFWKEMLSGTSKVFQERYGIRLNEVGLGLFRSLRKKWLRLRPRQRHKLMIWLVEWRKIIVLHVRHAFWCTTTWNFHFWILTTTRARSSKSLILCLCMTSIRTKQAKVLFAYFCT